MGAFIRRDTRELALSFCLHVCIKKRTYKHTVRWESPTGQEKRLKMETYFASTLILDFLAPRTMRNKIFWFKLPTLQYFVMVAQADKYT